MEDTYSVIILDQFLNDNMQTYIIPKPLINQDEETNSTSIFQLRRYDSTGNEIEYDIKELDMIFIKKNNKNIYNGIITKVADLEDYIEVSFKDIINIFDTEIDYDAGNMYRWQKDNGIEDAISYAINVHFTNGPYAQWIFPKVESHTPINVKIPNENGIFNLATYMNNARQYYDIEFEFNLLPFEEDDEWYYLQVIIKKKEETDKKIIDLKYTSDPQEIYKGSVLAVVVAIGPGYVSGSDYSQKETYILRTDGTVKSLNEGTSDLVYGKRTEIYVEDWSTRFQEVVNKFKGNSYDHLFQFVSEEDYSIGEQIILITTKGNKIETYISAKNILDNGYEYKTGKLRIDFIDKFLKEKRG